MRLGTANIRPVSGHFHTSSHYLSAMLLPKALRKGAVIGIISPASPQRDPSRLDRGAAYLESLGYRVELGPHVHARHAGYLAGTDAMRLQDLHTMVADPRIDAVFCARGGYGTPRLLEQLDLRLFKRNPKIIVGFSDITALQWALWKRCRLVTFSGMLPSVDFADTPDAESEEHFWRILTSTRPVGSLRQSTPLDPITRGDAIGTLLPGNLSMVVTLIGTPYMPSWNGAVPVLEDVGEETYRVDRMLTHLRLAGLPQQTAGMGFGWFTPSHARTSQTPHRDVREVLQECAADVRGPVIAGVMYGHEAKKLTLPVGVRVRLSSRRKGLHLLDAAVC